MYFRDKHASNATDVAYHIYQTTGFDRQLKIYLICCILHVCKTAFFLVVAGNNLFSLYDLSEWDGDIEWVSW